ncbi:Spx/MgsR family RNA polymerase-binding regulatory protein [Prochlorococcus sp. MIT 1223]|uniref:Spx/MgsR family RNA polymerase-binding regulatory protein n=1 Tax=Prochlorococcus sp. MIT 1223 TaxID=3096217 RepID=UPI002A755D77|nr:Spx/MgsR family RNA polymerase-binding regulatory protein [Prochlorococcus sp. MIT 1223]
MPEKIILYGYSRCNTCRKAEKWLKKNKINFDSIDIIDNPPDKKMILKAIRQYGHKKFLFNTSGLSYRAIGAKKIKQLSEDESIEALLNDPKLIKRPLIINKDKILIGFKEIEWEEVFL